MDRISSLDVKNAKTESFIAEGVNIRVIEREGEKPLFCLTDIARFKSQDEPNRVIENWIRLESTIPFLMSYEGIESKDRVVPSLARPSVSALSKIGIKSIVSRRGRFHSGTYAEREVAIEFMTCISPQFKLKVIEAYISWIEDKRSWDLKRMLVKEALTEYTQAIKECILPKHREDHHCWVYAKWVDLLNMVAFGYTAREWQDANPELDGNQRDHATVGRLIFMSKLETLGCYLIELGKSFEEVADGMFLFARNYSVKKLK
ncbi:MAG: KilA-N domain-containing protein [Aeromonas sp.]